MSIDLVAEPLSQRVVRRIREVMGGQQLSQRQLGELLGHNQAWVSYRLAGRKDLTLTELEEIARVLYVPIDRLLNSEIGRSRRAS